MVSNVYAGQNPEFTAGGKFFYPHEYFWHHLIAKGPSVVHTVNQRICRGLAITRKFGHIGRSRLMDGNQRLILFLLICQVVLMATIVGIELSDRIG